MVTSARLLVTHNVLTITTISVGLYPLHKKPVATCIGRLIYLLIQFDLIQVHRQAVEDMQLQGVFCCLHFLLQDV